nr:RNA-dependent RNA polymerase [Aedes aegypti anphevirus]
MANEVWCCEDEDWEINCEEMRYLANDVTYQEEATGQRRMTACIPGHLASPIYGEEVDMLMSGKKIRRSCYRHRKVRAHIEQCTSFRELTDPMGSLELWIMGRPISKSTVDMRIKCMMQGAVTWKIQKTSFLKPLEHLVSSKETLDHCDSVISRIRSSINSLRVDLENMIRVEAIKDAICFKEIEMGSFIQHMGGKFERELSIIPMRGKLYLLPTNLLLCALDKMQAMFPLKLNWLISDILERYPGLSILKIGSEILGKFKKLRSIRQEGYHSFLAAWEPLVVGDTIRQPGDLGNLALYVHQRSSMEDHLRVTKSPLKIEELLPRTEGGENERRMFLELTGIAKMTGYPILKADKLLDQLREHGTGYPETIEPTVVNTVVAICRRDWMLSYFRKKGCYPKLVSYPVEFKGFIDKNKEPQEKYMTMYDLWGSVTFGKTLNFNYSPDLAEITKDSACAVEFQEWPSTFDRCAFQYLYDKDPPRTPRVKSHRRVIDAFITAEPDLLKKEMNKRERGAMDMKDKIIIQCGKELELKEDTGRAFTKQTATQRYFQVSLESNTADGIFPYVDEQSMTESETAIANKHMSQVKAMGGTSEFVSLDLTKWCLRHRQVMIRPIGRMYDEIFGLNGIYENSHLFFCGVPTFCNNRFSPPDYDSQGPIPGPFYLEDFCGGCEGMHQKKWTHFTIGVIKLALERCKMKGTIMGQGDNQVILLHYSMEDLPNKDVMRAAFLRTCETYFEAVGHRLKPQETWYSSKLHEYGKQRIYNGMSITMATKKATKCIPDINDGLFSIPSSISTLNTTTESIAKGSIDPDAAFLMNQMLVANYLCRKKLNFDCSMNPEDAVATSLLFPADFGGLPLSTYSSHAVRGHDDPVTTWLGIAMTLKEHFPARYRTVMNVWRMRPNSPASSALERTRLYEDPFSLNIRSLPSAESEIRQHTLAFLKSAAVTNPCIKKLYSTDVSVSYSELIRILDTMEPCYPQFANAILKDSNAGIGKMLQAKLTNSKTIEKATVSYTQVSLIDLIKEKNAELSRELSRRLSSNNFSTNTRYLSVICPYELAEKLRKDSWGKNFIGLSKAPYYHQVVLKDIDAATEDERNRSIVIKLSDQAREGHPYFSTGFGPYKPYVGSRTKEKVTKPTIDLTEKTSYTRAFKRLGKLKTWLQIISAPNLTSLIDRLLCEKLELIVLPDCADDISGVFAKIRSGNIFHRLSTDVERSSAQINSLVTIPSHFSQSSNLLQGMSQDGEDYSIFFQKIYAENMAALSLGSRIKPGSLPPVCVAILQCRSCTHVLPDPDFDIKPQNVTVETPIMLDSKSTPVLPASNLDTSLLFNISIGLDLAQNVDDNFKANHQGHTSFSSTVVVKKGKVSVNDFKRCDLLVILLSMIYYSTHCHRILFGRDELLRKSSNDLSFSYVADLITESDRREALFELLGREVSEHTMVTKSERMSAYIARSILPFYKTNIETVVQKILPIQFLEDMRSWRLKHAVLALIGFCRQSRLYPKVDEGTRQNALMWNMYQVKKAFGVKHTVVRIARESILTEWRAAPTITYRPPTAVRREVFLPDTAYPLAEADAYHRLRFLNQQGPLCYPFLSFLSRSIVFISSAASKYLECLAAVRFFDNHKYKNGVVLSLAEGSGGVQNTLLTLLPNSEGMYNTWMNPNIDNRDCATDVKAPACVVSGLTGVARSHELAFGETNILSHSFLEKLGRCCKDKNILVVTMDAESMMHSTNIEFVDKLFPVVLGFHPLIVIFKMFNYGSLSDQIKGVRGMYPDYDFVFFKPISSNPVGREIFLIGARLGEGMALDPLKRNEYTQLSYTGNLSGLDSLSFESYVGVSLRMRSYFSSFFVMASASYGDRPLVEGACGLICRVQLAALSASMDRVHNNEDDPDVHTVIRACGTNEWLSNKLPDYTFLQIMFSYPSMTLKQMLATLEKCSLTGRMREFRAAMGNTEVQIPLLQINISGGDFLEKWKDVKFYMRNWGGTCRCTFNVRVIPHGVRSLSFHIDKSLEESGVLPMGQRIRLTQRSKERFNPPILSLE